MRKYETSGAPGFTMLLEWLGFGYCILGLRSCRADPYARQGPTVMSQEPPFPVVVHLAQKRFDRLTILG